MSHSKYPLMRNNILREDLDNVIDYLRTDDPMLTNGKKVIEFEKDWSNWLGVKHSVFVNSGSSANLLTMFLLKKMFPKGGEVIVPPLTWVSDITSVILAGFEPVFCDLDMNTLGMKDDEIIKKLSHRTRAVFITHVQGFNALTDKLLEYLKEKKIILIEDVCESHGATHNGRKLGTYGLISNFSFYYAHHMSTIEGGMICTNDEEIYQDLRMFRSHGLLRECTSENLKNKVEKANPDLNPEFIFAHAGFNVRNTEIGGILGLSQLKRLDENIKVRTRNLHLFLKLINQEFFQTDFKVEGSSNYAFNLILKEGNLNIAGKIIEHLNKHRIEFRRGSAGGGNQLRQPYLRGLVGREEFKNYPVTEHIHFFGFYLGNYPGLSEEEVTELCNLINKVF